MGDHACILLVGDIVGRPGRRVLKEQLPALQSGFGVDFTVVNIENASGGFGVTSKVLSELSNLHIDVYTSGNHIWDKREALDLVDTHAELLRPHNYPNGTPGSGTIEKQTADGRAVRVVNLMGQVGMNPSLDSPFECVDRVLAESSAEIVLVDFHAEMTSEKMAMGWYLDGRVSAVVGTHTHVPTADERVLPGGTAYISDLGMTGCYDSVIGSNTEMVLQRMVKKLPARLEPATGKGSLCAVLVEVNGDGKAVGIERIRVEEGDTCERSE
ncbi:MAG: TIGR00282 family metallophosphoesterase [Pseudomonadota bacterium]